jgi:colanic acid biosynthesis glycosyl transferase WcaI
MGASAHTPALRRVRRRAFGIVRLRGLLAGRTSLDRLSFALLGVALVAIAWNGVKVAGLSLFYLALVPAAAALVVRAMAAGRGARLPGWLWLSAGGIAAAAGLAALLPPSEAYVRGRYEHVTALVRWAGRTESQSNLGNLVKFQLCVIGIPLLVGLAGRSARSLGRLADVWLVSGLASAAVAVSDELRVTHISSHALGIPTWGRQAGLTTSPNHVAVMSAIAVPLAALWLLRSPRWRVAGAVALGLLFGAIYASGSRGGLLAGPIALVGAASAVPALRRHARRLLAAAAVLAAVWIPIVLLHSRSGASTSKSDYERHHLLLQAGADIAHSPVFGLGFRVVNQAHDIYLQLLASGGAIALGAFLVLVAGTIGAARVAVRVDPQLGIACSAAVGTWLLVGFLENQLIEPYLYVPVGVLVALAGLSARAAPARAAGPLRVVVHDYAGHPHQARLSRELARRGHEVLHLHCPSYRSGKGALSRTASDPPGFAVEPVALDERFEKYAPWKRLRQECSYGRRLVERISAYRPDVVVSSNNPLFSQQLLLRWCRRNRIRFVFWQQDIYGVAMQRGLARRLPVLGAAVGHLFVALERRQLRSSSAVVCISEDFRPFLLEAGVPAERIFVVENWAPLDELSPRPRDNAWARSHGLVGKQVLLYSGTLGVKHNPELLLELARSFHDDPCVRVVVVSEGRGADAIRLGIAAEGLDNLLLLDFQPYADLPDVLATGDVLLAILEQDAGVFSVPSKVLSYHCAERPLLAAVPDTNLSAHVLERARSGVVVSPDDPQALAAAARTLLEDLALRERLGHNAWRYAERAFDIERIGDRFDQIVQAPKSPVARPAAAVGF